MCLGTAHRTEPPLSPPPQGPGLSPGHVLWFPMDCCWGSMNGRLGYIHLIHEALPSIFGPERHQNSYDFTCICSTFFRCWGLLVLHELEAGAHTLDTWGSALQIWPWKASNFIRFYLHLLYFFFAVGSCWCSMNLMLGPIHCMHEALPSILGPEPGAPKNLGLQPGTFPPKKSKTSP